MKLHIRFGSLDAFDLLYKRSELLQDVLIKESGIRWRFDKKNRDEIDKLLKGRERFNFIKYLL